MKKLGTVLRIILKVTIFCRPWIIFYTLLVDYAMKQGIEVRDTINISEYNSCISSDGSLIYFSIIGKSAINSMIREVFHLKVSDESSSCLCIDAITGDTEVITVEEANLILSNIALEALKYIIIPNELEIVVCDDDASLCLISAAEGPEYSIT